jgi:hypothetical protein
MRGRLFANWHPQRLPILVRLRATLCSDGSVRFEFATPAWKEENWPDDAVFWLKRVLEEGPTDEIGALEDLGKSRYFREDFGESRTAFRDKPEHLRSEATDTFLSFAPKHHRAMYSDYLHYCLLADHDFLPRSKSPAQPRVEDALNSRSWSICLWDKWRSSPVERCYCPSITGRRNISPSDTPRAQHS